MSLRRGLLGVLALLLLAGCASGQAWEEGSEHDGWRVVFDGHGVVRPDGDGVLLEPRHAASADVTHGGLVVTTQAHPAGTDLAITASTQEQVREGDPNPWEVAWVLWNYQDPEHFYAVVLKPNGWEVSKQDPAYPGNQRFLASGTEPRFPIGADYRVEVEQADGVMSVSVDGEQLAEVTDTERPYTEGAIGLYTEDARVRFADLRTGR
ncbi:calcium-binding protein [Serinicoccus sp. CNJ-927]|uniref:calcium-binding protein n=1 Tax=Serinicoccus sp. CNJ-927 TaxID=1904970 RepID=UPI00096192C5|nr:calcium-binding protein [Serinicoccus sp. CNJ-927]OLT39564.1 calcium-binding protein [Serinicoccus sp. CNJ-927]